MILHTYNCKHPPLCGHYHIILLTERNFIQKINIPTRFTIIQLTSTNENITKITKSCTDRIFLSDKFNKVHDKTFLLKTNTTDNCTILLTRHCYESKNNDRVMTFLQMSTLYLFVNTLINC